MALEVSLLSILLLLASALAATWPGDPQAASQDWKRIDSGVQYVDLAPGGAPAAVEGARVVVHYTGMLEDGTVFDSSLDRGQTFSFTIGQHQVIRGWEDGLIGAGPGTRRHLVIPPDQGYGDRAGGPIPPGSTLYFEVQVVEVFPPRTAPESPERVDPDSFRKKRGLEYADLHIGSGNRPTKEERVCVDWTAWVGGKLVDNTLDREDCRWFRYEPGKVPEGLFLGLSTMREGGLRQLRVPPELALAPLRPEGVPAGEPILYEVRLVEAKTKVK